MSMCHKKDKIITSKSSETLGTIKLTVPTAP